MDVVLISVVALIGSILTFFSGFGLGTLLLPVFALFFPIQAAIGMTALIHLMNNLFKLGLVGKHLDGSVFVRFSLPTIPAAMAGAYLLIGLSHVEPIFTYSIGSAEYKVELVKIAIAVLMVIFSLFEIIPKWSRWTVNKKYLPLGGIISGFFGGLSGHQGALRSAFLIRAGISKEKFIGTGVATACLVDLTRISVYGSNISAMNFHGNIDILFSATLSAFIGAYLGNKLLKKATFNVVQMVVAGLLFIVAILLGSGII